jgi:hypothetical protein
MKTEDYEIVESKPLKKKGHSWPKVNKTHIKDPVKVAVNISGENLRQLFEYCTIGKFSLSDALNMLITPKAIKALASESERHTIDNRLRMLEEQLEVIEKEKRSLLSKKKKLDENYIN